MSSSRQTLDKDLWCFLWNFKIVLTYYVWFAKCWNHSRSLSTTHFWISAIPSTSFCIHHCNSLTHKNQLLSNKEHHYDNFIIIKNTPKDNNYLTKFINKTKPRRKQLLSKATHRIATSTIHRAIIIYQNIISFLTFVMNSCLTWNPVHTTYASRLIAFGSILHLGPQILILHSCKNSVYIDRTSFP